MTIKYLSLALAISLGWCAAVMAQEGLQLSGIVEGARRGAIVNDQIVTVGDSVGEYRVVEIGADHAVFENTKGKRTIRLKELDAKQTKPLRAGATPPVKPPTVVNVPAEAAGNSQQPKSLIPEKASKHLDRSIDNLKQADELLKSQIKFDALYVKAAAFCADAGREAQAALRLIYDEGSRRPVQLHIAKIQQVQTAIIREKEDLNTRVRTAIVNQKIFVGMTSQNIISSWGPPLSKTNVGTQERWAYKDPNGYQRNLSFSKGILVSY